MPRYLVRRTSEETIVVNNAEDRADAELIASHTNQWDTENVEYETRTLDEDGWILDDEDEEDD